MEISQIIPHIEALIFAADRPLPLLDVLDLLNNALAFLEDRATLEQVEASLEAIKEKYNSEFYAFEVRESGGGYQFLTKKEYYQTVAQLNGDKFLKRLSTAALETLAIVAYKQPISKGEIEHIRGVSTDYSIQKLLEKELIVISGRSENLPGKPLLYATSKAFMDYFGLNSPKDLPKLKEVFDDESIQPTLIGLEAEAANDDDARNMVVSETGELVEQDDNVEGPEAHLNGGKVSTEEIPVVDSPDKKNNDLQAKLFLPFDEEIPQNEEEAVAAAEGTGIVSADDDIVAGTEIPTMDEALAEGDVEENEEENTATAENEEEEEVTYATEEELAAFLESAADVGPKGDDEEDDEDGDDDEDKEDGGDEEDDDDDDDDDEDWDDEDEEDEEEDNDDEDGDEEEDDDDDDNAKKADANTADDDDFDEDNLEDFDTDEDFDDEDDEDDDEKK
ncbi:SMC-Scp complex subunit ScpB [Chitinophaga pinensis]|uniref:Chromosome segregation and condensation protein, ScpB n=1 Tax=Chitinophaga pinensis (strain ATCC 43595 / DSM 2588 / LMG 13176 / NBRC 15968 / NCIMB 11800 / UQM 2034) TaxID=485918 RepID=A0A979GCQ8_CHIPD|nr:SMC-Scp complex subunit ScpB [Chitinophaga pinensis]ACU64648.1 chromosome segregation and condensation protein, ScpB [Chitinophaga pinensis DSM 2588]